MIAVEIDFLTGRYAATAHDDRQAPEWPVHPQRLFSAMVANWADAGEDANERAALEWLEAQEPPSIVCSGAARRWAGPSYVPVNDAAVVRDMTVGYLKLSEALNGERAAIEAGDAKQAARASKQVDKLRRKAVTDSAKAGAANASTATTALAVLPDNRPRQPRDYPTVVPDDPKMTIVWHSAEPADEVRDSLDHMLERVHRLGHSSSFVSCRLTDEAASPTLVPDDRGEHTIRVPRTGLLRELEAAFAAHRGEDPRVLPSRQIAYGSVRQRIRTTSSAFNRNWVPLEIVGPHMLPSHRTVDLTRAIRDALRRHHPDPLPEFLSGHQPGKGEHTPATTSPHLAVVALPFVGHNHADGSIQGAALIFPSVSTAEDRAAVDLALARWAADDEKRSDLLVFLGASGRLRLRQGETPSVATTLRPGVWSRPSTKWASATPVALDHHPGDLWSSQPRKRERAEVRAIESVGRACSVIGLPAPVEIALDRACPLQGGASVSRYPVFQGGHGPRRALVHVRVTFPEPVMGPIVLGAGRFLGLGLLFPTSERGERS